MKITDIKTHIVAEERNFLFVTVETDEGIRGIGEGGITWKEQATAGYIEALKPALIGEDPFRTEHLWQVMSRGGFFPAQGVGAAAVSAIDIALWDIKAKALEVPLYQLLGGLVRDRVACYPHVRGDTTADLVRDARQKVAEGWPFVRFDLPTQGQELFDARTAVRSGIEQVAAVRDTVGDSVEIILDVHTRLDPVDAITLCRGLESLRPYFVEDPIRSESPSSLKRLREQTAVPIAVGEQFGSKWAFQEIIEKDWTDFARIDLCIVGGISESLKIAGWCETHFILVAPHNPLGPVSTAACLHLDLAISNFAVQECARVPGQVLSDLFPVQVPFDNGYLSPPTQPGLGIEFDESQVPNFPPIPAGATPRLNRPDGSFTNW